jgi:glycosyltransferase involved in cell wall biosynthesis
MVHAPEGFDVVHSVSLAAPALRSTSRSHLVVTVHAMAWRRHPDATTPRGRRWHEGALARARARGASLVVPSRLVAADLAASGVDAGRITVVPSGADHLPVPDPAAADALLAAAGVPGEFLLSVGTLEPRKNVGRLVRAFTQVRPSLPAPWRLVVVGPTGWGPERHPPSQAEGVVFTGAVAGPVLAELYRRARAEVPSVHDLGAPEPSPARIVDPLDVDDIAAGLAAVLTDDALRADLAARGSAYARERTWARAARAHVRLWRSLA